MGGAACTSPGCTQAVGSSPGSSDAVLRWSATGGDKCHASSANISCDVDAVTDGGSSAVGPGGPVCALAQRDSVRKMGGIRRRGCSRGCSRACRRRSGTASVDAAANGTASVDAAAGRAASVDAAASGTASVDTAANGTASVDAAAGRAGRLELPTTCMDATAGSAIGVDVAASAATGLDAAADSAAPMDLPAAAWLGVADTATGSLGVSAAIMGIEHSASHPARSTLVRRRPATAVVVGRARARATAVVVGRTRAASVALGRANDTTVDPCPRHDTMYGTGWLRQPESTVGCGSPEPAGSGLERRRCCRSDTGSAVGYGVGSFCRPVRQRTGRVGSATAAAAAAAATGQDGPRRMAGPALIRRVGHAGAVGTPSRSDS